MARDARADDGYRYSVAWIDTLARGPALGPVGADPRATTRPLDELPAPRRAATRWRRRATRGSRAPPCVPGGLVSTG